MKIPLFQHYSKFRENVRYVESHDLVGELLSALTGCPRLPGRGLEYENRKTFQSIFKFLSKSQAVGGPLWCVESPGGHMSIRQDKPSH